MDIIRNPECDLCQFGISSPKPPKNICLLPEDVEQHDVMLVAETPTVQDDLWGLPFTGKGLSEIMAKLTNMGLDVYGTYAVKCVKPKDKKVKPAEAKLCGFGKALTKGAPISGGYLQKEIEQVKPKHIICMGANTFLAVTGKTGAFAELKSNRYFDERLNAYIYATEHHASAMYNIQVREHLHADLERFKKWMDNDKSKDAQQVKFDPPVKVAASLKALRSMQNKIRAAGGIVAVDTETQGLNPYALDKEVRCIQFCWDTEYGGVFVPLALEDDCYYTNPEDIHDFWKGDETLDDAIEIIREILLESSCIWHNGKFDRIWLHQWGKRRFGKPIRAPHIYMDTMHVAHSLNENRELKLKRLITTELGFPTYDINDKLTKDLDIMIPYATRDTVASLMLAQKYRDILKNKEMRKLRKMYANITCNADKLFTKMELRGWPVDGDRARACQENIEGLIDECEKKMFAILDEASGGELPHDAKQFASTQKLAKLLFEVLKLPMNSDRQLAYTETGAPATGENALVHLKGTPFVDLILEWRGLNKALSTYVLPMIRAAEGRGRITTSYKLTGTVTGRTASGKEKSTSKRQGTSVAEGMNLQNMLYTYNIRNCIKAKDGWSILECDLSQIELRIAGWLSNDPLFIKAYTEGWDIHAIRAMRVNGYTPEEWECLPEEKQSKLRKKAKPINFGFLYGMMAPTFQKYALLDYGIEFTMEECFNIRKQFFTDHAGLAPWYEKQEKECKELGYVESPTGRRRHLPNIKLNPDSSKDAKSKYNEAVRMSINTPVQGFGSDWKLMSMIETDEMITRLFRGSAYLFGEVHDSILLEVRDDVLEEVTKRVLKIMSHPKLLDVLGIDIKLPVLAEAKAGPSLGEAKDYKVDWQSVEVDWRD